MGLDPEFGFSAVALARRFERSFMIVFAALLTVHPAAAAPEAESAVSTAAKEEAIARYNRGIELYQKDIYEPALAEFRKAYELAPNFRVLYNIAQVCFQLKDYPCALQNFERYLAEGQTQVPDERQREVEKEVSTLQAFVGRLEVTSNVSGGIIAVDDVVIGTTPLPAPLLVTGGRRKVTLSKDGFWPESRLVDVPVGGQNNIRFDLTPTATPPSSKSEQTPTASVGESRSLFTTWSWVGVGAAAALGTAGVVTGTLALRESADYHNSVHATEQSGSDDRSAARHLALASDVLLVASVATLATTLVLTFTTRPKGATRIGVGVAGQRAFVQGSF